MSLSSFREVPMEAFGDLDDITSSGPIPVITHETAVFAHAVNTRAKLTAALHDPTINMLEADIIMGIEEDTSSQTSTSSSTSSSSSSSTSSSSSRRRIPVMGHNPGDNTWDITLAEWLREVATYKGGGTKGIKLDVKQYEAWSLMLKEVAVYERAGGGGGGVGGAEEGANGDKDADASLAVSGGMSNSPWPYFRIHKTIKPEHINTNNVSYLPGTEEERVSTRISNSGAGATPTTTSSSSSSPASGAFSFSFDVPAIILNADVLTGTILPITTQAPGCRFNPSNIVFSSTVPNKQQQQMTTTGDSGSDKDNNNADEHEDHNPTHDLLSPQVKVAKQVLKEAISTIPLAILSPGWTTAGENRKYTRFHVEEMIQVVDAMAGMKGNAILGLPITFPVRATYIRKSWIHLKELLDKYPATSLTVWSNVVLEKEEEAWLRKTLDPRRTMYDIPSSAAVATSSSSLPLLLQSLKPSLKDWAATMLGYYQDAKDENPHVYQAFFTGLLVSSAVLVVGSVLSIYLGNGQKRK